MPSVLTARLINGPHHGHTDVIVAPAPATITVMWCTGCGRDHLHVPEPDAWATTRELYLLDRAPDPDTVLYRFVDVDETVDRLTQPRVTPAPGPPAHHNCRSTLVPLRPA